jgi:hypothetical protein
MSSSAASSTASPFRFATASWTMPITVAAWAPPITEIW